MTNFLIIVVIGILVYMICELRKDESKVETKRELNYKEILPQYLNKHCEIKLKNPMISIDVLYSIQGIILDMDEDWIMVMREEKAVSKVKVLRIENISGIKEIIQG